MSLPATLLFIAGAVLFGLAIGLLTRVLPFTVTGSNWLLGALFVILVLMGVESFRRSRRYHRLHRRASARR